jgi:CAI-1 autoinducer synthase
MRACACMRTPGACAAAFSELGYPIHQGSEQIIALEAARKRHLALRDRLEERNVFGAMFCAPATSRNRAMMRMTLSAGLMDSELDHVEAVAREIAPIVKPWDWPIARRARAGPERPGTPAASPVVASRRRWR